MLNVTLIVLGKLKEKFLTMASDEYVKRLGGMCKINIIELSQSPLPENPSPALIKQALDKEASEIISKIPKNAEVVSLCVEGRQMTSSQFSRFFDETALKGINDIVFIIGSSYGLSDTVKKMSRLRLSMSEMTFPHHLARIMLLEQIYRAFMISLGRKYDK